MDSSLYAVAASIGSAGTRQFGHPDQLEAASGIGGWALDIVTGVVTLSEGACALQALPHPPPPGEATLEAWFGRLHPDDRASAVDAMTAAMRDGTPLRHEFRIRLPDGGWRWLEGRGRRLDAEDGTPIGFIGVDVDINDRKQAETRTQLVLREVEHRAKNAIAAAQAVVRLTRAEDPSDFTRRVERRLAALGRAHARLSAVPPGEGVEALPLIEAELAPYDPGGAVRLRGPRTFVSAGCVQPVCMALHELATNAAKYGALSRHGGSLSLAWRRPVQGGLVLFWREFGGPVPMQPPERRGFGLSLLDALVRGQLGGTLRIAWRPQGVAVIAWLPAGCVAEE